MNTARIQNQIGQLLAVARCARRGLNHARMDKRAAVERVEDARDARQIVQEVAQIVQRKAHARLSAVVTRCLRAVFGPTFKFRVVFDKKRGKTEARLQILEGGLELELDDCAGGVVDVAAFALRLACLLLCRPARRRLLVLDEAFRFVSDRNEYRERVRELIWTLSVELNVQIIMVTHSRELEIGKVIEL